MVAGAGEAVVGLLLLASGLLLLIGRDRMGVRLGRAGLVFALAVVNVALGYVDAELVVSAVVAELLLLGLLMRYRTRFLPRATGAPPPPPESPPAPGGLVDGHGAAGVATPTP
jgi:hypothetical protein